MDELLARIEALEKELRALKAQRVSVATLPFRLINERGGKVLEVEQGPAGPRLNLFDGQGKLVASLAGLSHGGHLCLYGAEGKPAAWLSTGEHGGHLAIYNAAGQIVAHLDAPHHHGHLGLRSEHGQPVAVLFAGGRNGGLELRDAGGHILFSAPSARQE